jgi:hypothetical protein
VQAAPVVERMTGMQQEPQVQTWRVALDIF